MNDNTAPTDPMSLAVSADVPRTYLVRTLGCQMNQHDSERIAGLLEDSGLVPVESVPSAMLRATDAGDGGGLSLRRFGHVTELVADIAARAPRRSAK